MNNATMDLPCGLDLGEISKHEKYWGHGTSNPEDNDGNAAKGSIGRDIAVCIGSSRSTPMTRTMKTT